MTVFEIMKTHKAIITTSRTGITERLSLIHEICNSFIEITDINDIEYFIKAIIDKVYVKEEFGQNRTKVANSEIYHSDLEDEEGNNISEEYFSIMEDKVLLARRV